MPAARHRAAWLLPLAGSCLGAAQAAEPPPAAPAQRVEISATAAAADDGRDSAAARQVVGREEIARHGDTSIVDVLRRVPGITVGGGAGRAEDIRLRGLGAGYTQILIDGEPVPAGFSLASLSPAQIERIEIARVATVDTASQAIAGTINLVLRRATRSASRELKAAVASRAGRGTVQLDGQFSDRLDGQAWSLGTGLGRRSDAWSSSTVQQATDAAGQLTSQRFGERRTTGLADSLSLKPRWVPALGDAARLSLEGLWRANRFDDRTEDTRRAALGAPPAYAGDEQRLALRTSLAQLRLQGSRTLDSGVTVEARVGVSRLQRRSDTRFDGRDDGGGLALAERVTSSTGERGLTAAGKVRWPWLESHALAVGWDAEHTRRDETRTQRQSSPIGRPVQDLDERWRTTVQRFALYAQDEWERDESLSAYAGVRWAGLRTRSGALDAPAVGQHSAVASPVLQLLWKPPGWGGDRLRFALSRSYKPPRAADLTPRRFVAIDNTPATPNLQGNPALRPELAWGLDLAVEHDWPREAGSVSLAASARRIRDVVLDRLGFDNGAWVETKANGGRASVFGLELDARLRLRAAWPEAPDVSLRAAVARYTSRVDDLPAPDNRLDGQVPLSASLGLDWRAATQPLGAGFSLAHRGRQRARSSATQTSTSDAVTTLDLYLTWKPAPAAELRLSVQNLLAPTERSTDLVEDAGGRFLQATAAPAAPSLRLTLEWKL